MSNDNAGGGLRGLRAELTANLVESIRACYGWDKSSEVKDLGGSSNLNLLVSAGHDQYVVRVYRPYVSTARLEAIQHVRHELTKEGIPCAELIPTRRGEPYTQIEGRLIEMERFVESDGKMDSWERLVQGMPWLGRIHSLLRTITVSPEGKAPLFANHIEPSETLMWIARATQRVHDWGSTVEERRWMESANILANKIAEKEQDLTPFVLHQLVHGDFWDNNVFFRKGQLALVTDFDFMGERARIDDLALILYFYDSQFGASSISSERLDHLRLLINAYDSGLEMKMTEGEREALLWAIARQPLWWVGRWLALLDDETEARRGLAGMEMDLAWASQLLNDIDKWELSLA